MKAVEQEFVTTARWSCGPSVRSKGLNSISYSLLACMGRNGMSGCFGCTLLRRRTPHWRAGGYLGR